MPLLFLLFIIVPIAELYVIIKVAQNTGVFNSILLLILVSFIGAWLVRAQGIGIIRKIKSQLTMGQIPNKELVDGGLVLFAGALMLTPGFLTDALGLLLLFPLTRPIFRGLITSRFKQKTSIFGQSNQNESKKNNSRNSFFFYQNDQGRIIDQHAEDNGEDYPPESYDD
ncbi:MAG: FxsA family protein [Actinomycetota bacterium]|nr:FxsA family protein [Actinomycetota bacterium]MEC8118731.1 FxsA family protein [Actinomycetota bacterium]MEC9210582.1 FxsA family protein [Actinomycetota bacterium]MEE3016102.1 FxsA family protein [Actinomycetota bacterium]